MELNRVYNMDCLEGVKKLEDNSIDLINIDPPYVGVVKAKWDEQNAFTPELVKELYRVLKPTGSIYVWCGIGEKSRSLLDFIPILDKEFHFKQLITWKKNRGIGMIKGWLFTREELLWYVKDNKQFIWNKDKQYSNEKRPWSIVKKGGEMVNKSEYKRITNVWTDINEVGYGSSPLGFKKIKDKIKHITPKPVEAIERTILLHTKENDVILDCFGGSGTTAIAAINTNRQYILFENDTDIFNASIERIKDVLSNK